MASFGSRGTATQGFKQMLPGPAPARCQLGLGAGPRCMARAEVAVLTPASDSDEPLLASLSTPTPALLAAGPLRPLRPKKACVLFNASRTVWRVEGFHLASFLEGRPGSRDPGPASHLTMRGRDSDDGQLTSSSMEVSLYQRPACLRSLVPASICVHRGAPAQTGRASSWLPDSGSLPRYLSASVGSILRPDIGSLPRHSKHCLGSCGVTMLSADSPLMCPELLHKGCVQ